MLSLICVLSLFLGQALGSQSANQYVDTVINTSLQNVIRNDIFEPSPLSNFTFEYKDKTFFGSVKGKAEYSYGLLRGFSTVKRSSDCYGPRNVSSNTVINCTLVFQSLETIYKGRVKYGVLPKVTIQAKGNVQYVYIDVGILKSASGGYPKVETFSISRTGFMNTIFTGLGPLNKHMKVLEENYKSVVSGFVTNAIINRFQYALNQALAYLPMPIR